MSPPPHDSVDVIIAAWNSAATIGRAVTSALADPAVSRVIVIDDASGDDTATQAAAAAVTSGRLIVQRLASNGGPSRARNAALELSTGDWIAILDADDYFDGARIAKLLAFSADADIVGDDILQIQDGEVGRAVPQPLLSSEPFDAWQIDFKTFVNRNITRPGTSRKELGFLKPIIRRAFLDMTNLRYAEHLRLGEDFALYAAALARGARFLIVPAQGYVSVVRGDSLSARHSQNDLIQLRDSDYALMRTEQLAGEERSILKEHARSLDARVQWLEVIEAVKTKDATRFVRPFFRSTQVTRFLAARLAEQAWIRTRSRLRSG